MVNYLTQNEPKNYVKEAYNTNSDKYTTKERVFTKLKKGEESKVIINDKKMAKEVTKITSPRSGEINKSSKFNDEM